MKAVDFARKWNGPLSYHQNRHWAAGYDLRGLAPEEQSLHTTLAMRGHHDQAASGLPGRFDDGSGSPGIGYVDRIGLDARLLCCRVEWSKHLFGKFLTAYGVAFDIVRPGGPDRPACRYRVSLSNLFNPYRV